MVITLVYGFREDLPETEETKVNFICADCQHAFDITNKQYNEQVCEEWPPAPCPKCGKKAAWLSTLCDNCGLPFVRQNADGGAIACPKCYPDIEPPEEVYIEEDDDEPRQVPIMRI